MACLCCAALMFPQTGPSQRRQSSLLPGPSSPFGVLLPALSRHQAIGEGFPARTKGRKAHFERVYKELLSLSLCFFLFLNPFHCASSSEMPATENVPTVGGWTWADNGTLKRSLCDSSSSKAVRADPQRSDGLVNKTCCRGNGAQSLSALLKMSASEAAQWRFCSRHRGGSPLDVPLLT